jgi:hypothetical protein
VGVIRKACVECGRLAVAGSNRCGSHLAEFEARDNGRRNAKTVAHGVKRSHFQRLRRERLALARGVCELRLRGCTVRATSVHLDPRLAGDHDRAALGDVRAACAHCHGVVDAKRASR